MARFTKETPSRDGDFARLTESIRALQTEIERAFDIDPREMAELVNHTGRLAHYIDVNARDRGRCVTGRLERDLHSVRSRIGLSDDVIFREFNLGGKQDLKAAIVYIDGLVEKPRIHDDVLKPLMLLNHALMTFTRPVTPEEYLYLIRNHSLTVSQVQEIDRFDECIDHVLSGDTLLFVDGVPLGLVLGTRGWEGRPVDEPATESVIRGPRDGFTETLRTNTMLLRRRIKDPALRVRTLQIGRRTRTDVSICYLENIANPHLVEEVVRRIEAIDLDSVLESGYIEQMIEDDRLSPFPQIQNTERPSKLAAELLEGRIGILVDGTPFALVLPATFNQFYQSGDDYNERWLIGTLIRGVRLIALFSSLTVTAIYVALISFHPEMLPTRFAIAVAGGRSGIPFPSIVEALLMEVTMEILREASLRLPRPIGPTISIVGALVIGEAATRAGIVSPLMVIVVAVTTIGSFAIPSFSAAIALRILKFPVILAAGTFGLYGIMLALILITIHVASLKSVGIPYLSPITPLRLPDIKDTLVRLPMQLMFERPVTLRPRDRERMPERAEVIPGSQDRRDREEK